MKLEMNYFKNALISFSVFNISKMFFSVIFIESLKNRGRNKIKNIIANHSKISRGAEAIKLNIINPFVLFFNRKSIKL